MAKKILVIEDDADTCQGLNVRLRAYGYNMVFAVDGTSAITVAFEENPDLVLLDLGLPMGDGFSVLQCLKSSLRTMHIPVIVLSARDPVTHKQHSLEMGAVVYFQKPADTEQLMAAVRKELGEEDKATAKQKILIIEDDPEFRHALSIRLKGGNYETAFASDALVAMSEALKVKPDLILLDLGLPAGDGLVVLERLKQNALLSHTPVIIVTGRELRATEVEALGASGYFRKPLDHGALLVAIRKTLKGNQNSSPKPSVA